jgi:nitroreductase
MEKVEELLAKEEIVYTEQFGLASMIAFGYRTANAEIFRKTRQPIEEVVEWIY